MPRQARQLSESGYLHLIVRGIGKQILFEDREDRLFFLSRLKRFCAETNVSVLAYCLMENHVHLLVHDQEHSTPLLMKKLGVPYWNKGYATELGKAVIRSAFDTTPIKGIYGMARQENAASRKVLEKIGMDYLGNQVFRNHEDAFYYIANRKVHGE